MVGNYNNIKEMLTNVRKNIGKEIICKYYYCGNIFTCTSFLTGIKEYEYIILKKEPKYIQFVDFGEYIISIYDSDGNILYENTLFDKDNYIVQDIRGLINKQKLLFGVDYVSTEEQNTKKYLIKQGLSELEPKYYLNWVNFVNINYELRNYNEIKAAISYMNKINNGMSFYRAEIKVFSDEYPDIYNKYIVLDFINYIYATNGKYLDYIRSEFCTGGEYKSGTKKKTIHFIKRR